MPQIGEFCLREGDICELWNEKNKGTFAKRSMAIQSTRDEQA
jgi:hypothetical protein